jgi:hypothetical protein
MINEQSNAHDYQQLLWIIYARTNASSPPSTNIHCLHLVKNIIYNLWLGTLHQ